MASTGFTFPGTGTSIAGPAVQESSPAWATPANVVSDNGLNAAVDMRDDPGTNSEYLRASNFGFVIPASATIDGIEYRQIDRSSDEAPGAGGRYLTNKSIRLVDELAAVVGNDKDDAVDWPIVTSPETKTFGGVADLWGHTWIDTDINDIDFGGVTAVMFPSDADRGRGGIDAVSMNIHYTAAGGGGLSIPVAMHEYRQRHQSVV